MIEEALRPFEVFDRPDAHLEFGMRPAEVIWPVMMAGALLGLLRG